MPTLTKNGKTATIIASTPGKLKNPNMAPNPCGHFGATVLCTCRLRDRQCQTCKRVWVLAAAVAYRAAIRRWKRSYSVDATRGAAVADRDLFAAIGRMTRRPRGKAKP